MWNRLRVVDLSVIILTVGILVRVDAARRFDLHNGYDAAAHLGYSMELSKGSIPRVYKRGSWARQNPPLFYGGALWLQGLGFGLFGGVLISLLAGAARLVLADYAFRKMLGLSPPARHFANAIHAFLPFAIRVDIFYSPESLAVTLALAAVIAAWRGWAVVSGVILGLALLTKAPTVAAVPAVSFALTFGQGIDWRDRSSVLGAVRRLATAGVISALLLGQWAWPNMLKMKTPYPRVYSLNKGPLWKKPVWKRHPTRFFLPRLRYRDLQWPYYSLPVSAPNSFYLECWSDFYNFFNRGPTHRPPPHSANGRAVNPQVHNGYLVLVHVGFVLLLLLLAGLGGFALRAGRGRAPPGEWALAILGLCYLAIAIWFAVSVVMESHGAVKATYAIGATTILCAWTGRAFAWLGQKHWAVMALCGAACAIPGAVAVYQRFVW
ncbi:MAG: hypothetical protein ABI333_21675 [bacterium]